MSDKVLAPLEVVSRQLYWEAHQQANVAWNWVRLVLILIVMGIAIFVSHFTQFRTHVMRALVYNELPSNWWDVAIYVTILISVFVAFFWIMRKIDALVEVKIKIIHEELCDAYMQHLALMEKVKPHD